MPTSSVATTREEAEERQMNIEADSTGNYGTTVQATRPDGLQQRQPFSRTRRRSVIGPVPRYLSDSRARDGASSLRLTPSAPPAGALDWPGVVTQRVRYERGHIIFAQGDPAATVMYVEDGAVRMSVLSHNGKEAVVAILEAGHFFGEPCLAGHSKRMATATTIGPSTVRTIPKDEMIRHLHLTPAFADHFIAHMVQRNIRIEQDFVDQMFNSSEKRLARTLLLLARSGNANAPDRVIPRITQELLAEMVGTTRARINLFMNKFRRLGLVDYKSSGSLRINNSLLYVVLRDG
jgi:CRP/FNR family transcriptional regulator, cyclic AMP receptor protein